MFIGSVKPNIGHLESGAGVASLIKVLLMMKNELYVPSIHAKPLNPKIPFNQYHLKVCQEVRDWPKNQEGNRIACMNCFGFGGTNSHAVIKNIPHNREKYIKAFQTCLSLKQYVVLSAEDVIVLYNIAKHVKKSLRKDTSLKDLSSTTIHFRSHYRYRKVFVVEKMEELVDQLDQFVREELPVRIVAKETPKVIFVYCGVGTTWKNMCKELVKHDAIFRNSIRDIDAYLSSLANISVQSVFQNEKDLLDPLNNHLAIFACQIGLTEMWRHLGVCPDFILGQSVGEVAAAYASGTITLQDAVKVIYFRSLNLAEEINGNMIVIQNCKVEIIEEKCSQLRTGKANIAVYHSPLSCAVSGDTSAIEELKTTFSSNQVKIIPLSVKCAYHSHLTKVASVKLEENLKGLSWRYPPKTNIISTVSGELADENFGSASYWAANVFQPVQFHHAIKEAKKRHSNVVFLEIGPNPVLKAHLPNIFPDSSEDSLPSMKRNSEIETFRKTFIDMFGKGISVLWDNICPTTENILRIPQYQFNKRKHLLFSEQMLRLLGGEHNTSYNMLVSPISGSSNQFDIFINNENTPFVYEHIVDESVVMPGAIYGEIGIEIGNLLDSKYGCLDLSISWSIHKAFFVKENDQKLLVKTRQENEVAISYETLVPESSSLLSSGRIIFGGLQERPKIEVEWLLSILKPEREFLFLYTALQTVGFHHGPIYRTIKKCAIREKEAVCEVCLSESVMKELHRTYLHPVVIDTMFQSCSGIRLENMNGNITKVLPISVSRLQLRQRPSQKMICYAKLEYENSLNASFDILLLQENGDIVAEMWGFQVEKLDAPDNIQYLSYYEYWNPTKMFTSAAQLEQFSSNHVIVMSWNDEYVSLLQNAFNKNQTNTTVSCILLTKDFQKEISFLPNQIGIQKTSVVFAPGIPGIDESTTGKRLIDSVRHQSNAFLHILKVLYKKNVHVVVVTNETQPCVSKKTKVIGSELWGMVRAVAHEGTELTFTIIDIDVLSECALENIIKLSISSDFSNRHVPCELAIRNGVVFSNKIARMPEPFHTRLYKQGLQNPSQPICISIRQEVENTDRVFGIPSIQDFFCESKIRVKPVQVLLCNPETYFFSTNKYSSLALLDQKLKGNEIRICEIAGVARLNKVDIEVFACCQMELKSELEIDKKCVFSKSGFKGYKIGYLHSVTIAITIADHIAKKSNVMIICSQKNEQLLHFLGLLLKEKKCLISHDQLSCKRIQHSKVTDLIMLAHEEYINKEELCLQYPNIKRCYFLKRSITLIRNDVTHSVQFHYIDVESFFEPSHLCNVIQRSLRVLKSLLKKKTTENLPIHGCALDVIELTKQIEVRTSQDFLIRRDSAYIVVGGLTGLGWLIIKYLARRNAKIIISLSRRSISMEAAQRILNIKNLYGVEIIHKETDITNLDNLTKAIRSVEQKVPNVPIRGVFQGAAVINDNTVPNMTHEAFNLPLVVKILGTWNLHLVTKHMKLDIFMMHSSVASVFGNYSQTNYAAANAFEDSFAHYRTSLGLPAQTINWGALDVGMGSDPALRDIFFHKGIHLMTAEQICSCLTHMLLSDQTQGIFVDFDLKRFLTSNNLRWEHSKYTGLIPVEDEGSPQKVHSVEDNVNDFANMTDLVKSISAQVLMIAVSELEDTNTLAQFGVDSQNAIEIINAIFTATNVRLPILLLLSGDFSIQELGKYITEKQCIKSSDNEHADGLKSTDNLSILKRHFEFMLQQNSHLGFSFSISQCVNNAEMWRKIMQFVLRINSTLCFSATDIINENNSHASKTDVEDFILSFEHIKTKTARATQMLQLNHSILSVIYDETTEQSILHILCGRDHFDAFCGEIFLNDLQATSEYVIAGKRVPAWLDKPKINMISMYEAKLQSVADESKDFWANRLRLCKTSSSLQRVFKTETTSSNCRKISLPPIDISDMQNIALMKNWTTCNAVASVFQILLNKFTNAERVALLMEADLRHQLQELQEQIYPCSNFIPIISTNFHYPGASLQQILTENNKVIEESFSHGLLPYVVIKELPEFNSQIHETHSFLFHTTSEAHQYINFESVHVERSTRFETMLYAVHNQSNSSLKMEFHFCPERITSRVASAFVDNLMNLMGTLPKILSNTFMLVQTQIQPPDTGKEILSPGKTIFYYLKTNKSTA